MAKKRRITETDKIIKAVHRKDANLPLLMSKVRQRYEQMDRVMDGINDSEEIEEKLKKYRKEMRKMTRLLLVMTTRYTNNIAKEGMGRGKKEYERATEKYRERLTHGRE